MANTYKKVYLHIVFAVKNRQALLDKKWRDDIFKYIAGIINKRGHYTLEINGVSDHVHIFFDYNCEELISDLVREIKKASNKLINESGYSYFKFEWQKGYGVFSHSQKEKASIIKYIKNQEKHHQKTNFRSEYLRLLEAFEIEYKDEYVFKFFDEI